MTIRIALDAMGGDRGVPVNIEGAIQAKRDLDHEIILVGDQGLIEQELVHHGASGQFLIQHAPTVIGMHERPAEACRAKKDSSIMTCAELVAQGKADALISAGNSGATMAASLWHLRRLPGVSRPAIAAIFPTLEGHSVLLDVGANVDCKSKHLVQFAVMGSIYYRAVFGAEHPRVGLLTIGEEEGKGNDLTVETHPLLRASGLNYVGHVEGRDIPAGTADVYVCDGFVGNVLLKFGEGLASAVLKLIKNEVRKHPLAIFGKYLLKGAFKELMKKTDPSEFGGALLLGVNGVALIAHGGSDVKAVRNSVKTAAAFVEKGINRQISDFLHAQSVAATGVWFGARPMKGVRFLATGSGLPAKVLTNADLCKIVDTSDEWITERTGIKERRIAGPGEATSDLSARAARIALDRAGLRADQLDAIVVATCTPDHLFPSTACLVQKALGVPHTIAFDVSAACSGFVYGLAVVNGLIATGAAKTVLLIGADTLSRFTDWTDRGTCVLFGDGAGALIMTATDGPSDLLSVALSADGGKGDILKIPGGGSRHPLAKPEEAVSFPPVIKMEGKEVFKHAVTRMIEASLSALERAGRTPGDLTLLIPHQANLRIIDAVAKRVNIPDERVFRNVSKFGNMSAATTIVALDQALSEGRVKSGDLVELIAFGAGLTWGAAVLRWS